jgi:hypothetical protein
MKILFAPPLEKGDEGGFKEIMFLHIIHKISPTPSLPKRGISGSMTEKKMSRNVRDNTLGFRFKFKDHKSLMV